MQTSGLILDVYDDIDGSVLRSVYPTRESIPQTVKEAHVLSYEERRTLPDDVFALILLNNGESLRKYACIDAGGTALAVEYFLKTAYKLPVEAQKTAAENLCTACGWYDVEAPEQLQKMAGIISGAFGLATAVPTVTGTAREIKNNLANVRQGEAMGANIVVPGGAPGMPKVAEASGTALLPNQPTLGLPSASKTVIQKTARLGRLVASERSHHGGEQAVEPDVVHPPTHEQKGKLPQAGHLRPTCDVTNFEAPARMHEKKGSVFALPSEGKYPLDTYDQVKTANHWYSQYANHLTPDKRREFATNFMKRASELDIRTDNYDLKRYGSNTPASEAEIKAAFDARRLEVAHNDAALQLLGEVEKVARTRIWRDAGTIVELSPEQICGVVEEFDKVAGLNHRYDVVPDPYYTMFGVEKNADGKKDNNDPAWSDQIANDCVTSADLHRLAQIGALSVKTTFGNDFQEEFLKDPVGMYESLPRTQKKMLMRMANSTQPGVERTYF
jgi:hypothetical protein